MFYEKIVTTTKMSNSAFCERAWWEAFVISKCYGMGDPLAHDPKDRENSGEGRLHPSVTS